MRSLRLPFAALALLLSCVTGAPASAADAAADGAAVRQVVLDAYIDGIHNFKDAAAIRKGFHPDFEMLVLKDGKVVEHGPARQIFEAPQQAYTKALMAAAFELEAVETGAVRQ